MNLQEVKEKIKIEGADPYKNEVLLKLILEPTDCFGVDYKANHEECKVCTILADVGGRKEPVNVFCRELKERGFLAGDRTDQEAEKPLPEIKPQNDISWKEDVKRLYAQDVAKEEIIKQVTSKFPDITPGRIGSVLNGIRFQKDRMRQLQEKKNL